jgi:hypothetical protein
MDEGEKLVFELFDRLWTASFGEFEFDLPDVIIIGC